MKGIVIIKCLLNPVPRENTTNQIQKSQFIENYSIKSGLIREKALKISLLRASFLEICIAGIEVASIGVGSV